MLVFGVLRLRGFVVSEKKIVGKRLRKKKEEEQ